MNESATGYQQGSLAPVFR